MLTLAVGLLLAACGSSTEDGLDVGPVGSLDSVGTEPGSGLSSTTVGSTSASSTAPTQVIVVPSSDQATTEAQSTGSSAGASSTVSSTDPSSTDPSTTVQTTATETTTSAPAPVTTVPPGIDPSAADQLVPLRFESQVADVTAEELSAVAIAVLNDDRGWGRAGFRFVADPASPFRVVLAEGPEVDALCLPLRTGGRVSCQNGPVVALNADRWRVAVDHWEWGVETYRGYLVNHEVGHLIGQRHPTPRCPVEGRPAGVMEQQTGGLKGCVGNPWPRDWEIEHARQRPVVYGPLPAWGPDPVPANGES